MNSYTIAITGKGGTGKTTVAALLISQLVKRGCAPVLAVDADPNSCLDQVLGIKAVTSVGALREEARDLAKLQEGISKRELLELKIAESLVEAEGFDLIAMGRPEGPGCYCYANNVLRDVIRTVARSYPYIVIDNEAGLENLSRRIVQEVDLLVMVADPSKRGIETVQRLHALAREMDIRYGACAIIINRVRHSAHSGLYEELQRKLQADHLLLLPENGQVADCAETGTSLIELAEDNAVRAIINDFIANKLRLAT